MKRFAMPVTAALLFAAISGSLEAADEDEEDARGTGATLMVRVRYGGAPAMPARAFVNAGRDSSRYAKVEADPDGSSGRSTFESLDPGTYRIGAVGGAKDTLETSVTSVVLAAGEQRSVELEFPPSGTLVGRLRIVPGSNTSRMRIRVREAKTPPEPLEPRDFSGYVGTNSEVEADGSFRVGPLQRGKYELVFVLPRSQPTLGFRPRGFGCVFGAVPDELLPLGTVDIVPGRELERAFDLGAATPGAVELSVRVGGVPFANGIARFARRDANGEREVVVSAYLDGDGRTQVSPRSAGVFDVIAVDTKGHEHGVSTRPVTVRAGELVRAEVDVGAGSGR